MRERLVIAFVALTLGVLAVFTGVRAYALADLLREQDQRTADRLASVAAAVVNERIRDGEPVDRALLDTLPAVGDSVRYTPRTGDVVIGGARDVGDDPVTAAQQVPGGSVIVSISSTGAADRLAAELWRFAVLALALAAAGAAIGVVLATRLTRPFRELARATERFTVRGPAPTLPPYSVPEAERLRLALTSAVHRIEGFTERERALAVQASHELRTPVAALRLTLEDLALWPQTDPAVAEELERSVGELDRLNAAITALLDRQTAETVEVDLAGLVRTEAELWSGRTGRHVTVRGADSFTGRVDVHAAAEVIAAMLDSSAGEGGIALDLETDGSLLRVTMLDGTRRRHQPGPLHRGSGVAAGGLNDAAQAAESLGGHLTIEDGPDHRVTLVLPGT